MDDSVYWTPAEALAARFNQHPERALKGRSQEAIERKRQEIEQRLRRRSHGKRRR